MNDIEIDSDIKYNIVIFCTLVNIFFIFLDLLLLASLIESISYFNIFTSVEKKYTLNYFMILLSYLYKIYFVFKNKEVLKNNNFYPKTKIPIFTFIFILAFESFDNVNNSVFYFIVSFLAILFLNILIKNKKTLYYFFLVIISSVNLLISLSSYHLFPSDDNETTYQEKN